jgi:hypothetical protein
MSDLRCLQICACPNMKVNLIMVDVRLCCVVKCAGWTVLVQWGHQDCNLIMPSPVAMPRRQWLYHYAELVSQLSLWSSLSASSAAAAAVSPTNVAHQDTRWTAYAIRTVDLHGPVPRVTHHLAHVVTNMKTRIPMGIVQQHQLRLGLRHQFTVLVTRWMAFAIRIVDMCGPVPRVTHHSAHVATDMNTNIPMDIVIHSIRHRQLRHYPIVLVTRWMTCANCIVDMHGPFPRVTHSARAVTNMKTRITMGTVIHSIRHR